MEKYNKNIEQTLLVEFKKSCLDIYKEYGEKFLDQPISQNLTKWLKIKGSFWKFLSYFVNFSVDSVLFNFFSIVNFIYLAYVYILNILKKSMNTDFNCNYFWEPNNFHSNYFISSFEILLEHENFYLYKHSWENKFSDIVLLFMRWC